MQALVNESVMEMMSQLPEELLNISAGEYMEMGLTDPEFKAQWADKPFVFSDKYNLVTKPESNKDSSSEDK